MRPLLSLFIFISLFLSRTPAQAAEPFLKKGDIIALVGGEDMVVADECGYLELLLTRALPDYHLRFRSLAWEGDTVFEQRRDLNFPTWEEQFDKIGATVVIAQFGQMESLAGKEKLPEFIAAYGKLIERFSGAGKRRVVIVAPIGFSQAEHEPVLLDYTKAINQLTTAQHALFVDSRKLAGSIDHHDQRDGVHLTEAGHGDLAVVLGMKLAAAATISRPDSPELQSLLQEIRAKNRFWFDYWRIQNWAFLSGDRINQPSSRDHLDPSKRWFPPEREQFLTLLATKEKEIDALAAKLAQP